MPNHKNAATWKVEHLMTILDCDQSTAVEYLEAEEWDIDNAIASFRCDRKAMAAS